MTAIAIATSTDGQQVARFGHDFPLVAVDAAGKRSPRQAEGCCGHLAQAVSDCQAVICTAIGRGAAGHLAHAGVQLVVVPEGTAVEAALRQFRAGKLAAGGEPTACDHGHEHAHGEGDGHGKGHAHGGGCGCSA